jgi:hypothetical protein
MALITFTSDFGLKDHYVAAVKARILSEHPNANIVDITHDIQPFNLVNGSYVIRSVFEEFPPGSVHVVALNSHKMRKMVFIAAKLKGHYFVLPNNGLLSLISSNSPELVVELPMTGTSTLSFPEKNVLSKAAAQLAKGADITNLGKPINETEKALLLQPRASKSGIFGNVIYIDRFGNLITNIEKKVFEDIVKLSGPEYMINFSKEHVTTVKNHYGEVAEGDMLVFFNERGLLEIAVREGNASQLFGMRYDSPVRVTFGKK